MLPITIVPAVTDRPRQLLARRLAREPDPVGTAETNEVTAALAAPSAGPNRDRISLRDAPDGCRAD